MPKIKVRLFKAENKFKQDSGKYFDPYKVYSVEETDRVKDAIGMNLLEKIVDAKAQAEVEEATDLPLAESEKK